MGGKFSPILIIVLVLVVIAMGLFAFQLISGNNADKPPKTTSQPVELEKPVIDLEKVVNEDGTIKILVKATTNDEKGIECIVLPDGTTVESDNTEYIVTENGKYEFTVKGANGTEESSIMEITEKEQPSAANPYIPEGFNKISGSVDEGMVISDEYGNQYVWVPVPSGKLTRTKRLETEYTDSATELVNSVAKYYGFYIGRFEASQQEHNGEMVASSMEGKIPWTNITYTDANIYATASAKGYEYENGIRTSLVSSFAWDTALEWIDEKTPGYSSSSEYGNYTGTIYPTGTTETDCGDPVRQICDLAGNVREWTTETNKNDSTQTTTSSKNKNKNNTTENMIFKVLRGGGGTISRTPISRSGYAENLTNQYWGFRIILYKL